MNKQRRKEIKIIIGQLSELQTKLELINDEEQFAYDSLSEGLQSTLRGMESEEAIDILDEATEGIDDIIKSLTTI